MFKNIVYYHAHQKTDKKRGGKQTFCLGINERTESFVVLEVGSKEKGTSFTYTTKIALISKRTDHMKYNVRFL